MARDRHLILRRLDRVALANVSDLLDERLPSERGPTGEQRVHRRPQPVDIRASVELAAAVRPFGGHVGYVSDEFAGPRDLLGQTALDSLGEHQVAEFGRLVAFLQEYV